MLGGGLQGTCSPSHHLARVLKWNNVSGAVRESRKGRQPFPPHTPIGKVMCDICPSLLLPPRRPKATLCVTYASRTSPTCHPHATPFPPRRLKAIHCATSASRTSPTCPPWIRSCCAAARKRGGDGSPTSGVHIPHIVWICVCWGGGTSLTFFGQLYQLGLTLCFLPLTLCFHT